MVIDVIDVKPERTLPKAPDLIAEALYLEKKMSLFVHFHGTKKMMQVWI